MSWIKTELVLLFILSSIVINAQVDTVFLRKQVTDIKTTEDHNRFWQYLYEKDQTFRNVKTSKINDLENLISATYYLNRFGYPSKKEIISSRIMPTIWIHNSYPRVRQVAFPIILAGLKSSQISEKNIRQYYLRNTHWRKHYNEENLTKDLYTMYEDLNMSTNNKVNVPDIIDAYNESNAFVNQNFEVIGHWDYPREQTSVKILKSIDGQYYFYDLDISGSYPLKVFQDENYPTLFRNYYEPELYYGIQPNGDLTIKGCFKTMILKPKGS